MRQVLSNAAELFRAVANDIVTLPIRSARASYDQEKTVSANADWLLGKAEWGSEPSWKNKIGAAATVASLNLAKAAVSTAVADFAFNLSGSPAPGVIPAIGVAVATQLVLDVATLTAEQGYVDREVLMPRLDAALKKRSVGKSTGLQLNIK